MRDFKNEQRSVWKIKFDGSDRQLERVPTTSAVTKDREVGGIDTYQLNVSRTELWSRSRQLYDGLDWGK